MAESAKSKNLRDIWNLSVRLVRQAVVRIYSNLTMNNEHTWRWSHMRYLQQANISIYFNPCGLHTTTNINDEKVGHRNDSSCCCCDDNDNKEKQEKSESVKVCDYIVLMTSWGNFTNCERLFYTSLWTTFLSLPKPLQKRIHISLQWASIIFAHRKKRRRTEGQHHSSLMLKRIKLSRFEKIKVSREVKMRTDVNVSLFL